MCPPMREHWRHLADTIEPLLPSAHPSPHPNRSVQPFMHRSWQKVPILYNGCPFPPTLPLPMRDLDPKIAIWAPLHNFVGLYLRNWGTYRQSEKKLVKQQYVLHMCQQYGELRSTSGWDRLTSLGHTCKFQRVSRLGSVTARHLAVGVSQTLRRWTEGVTYIRQGDRHVGHGPTFLVFNCSFCCYIIQMIWYNRQSNAWTKR